MNGYHEKIPKLVDRSASPYNYYFLEKKFMNDNEILLNEICRNYENENKQKKRKIKIPGRMVFRESNTKITLWLSKESVCKNMQEDDASFEGWILALKRWLFEDKSKKQFVLSWENPSDPCNKHYQRFLYRANHFRQLFQWFEIEEIGKLEKLEIKDDCTYFLNQPSVHRIERKESNRKESDMEVKLICSEQFKNFTKISDPQRQLPVGIFKERVGKDNSIFPRGKSAIDIWGIDNHNRLNIFELKTGNIKVGVLSELFFYSMIMFDLKRKRFSYEILNNKIQKIQSASHHILSWILADKFHPLIDSKIIEIFNSGLKKKEVEFGLIQFSKDKDGFKFD